MKRKKPCASTYWESSYLNNQTYFDYLFKFTNLAINVFKWKNLPKEVDERYLELSLFMRGVVVFFRDEEAGKFACLPVDMHEPFSIYGIPYYRTAISNYNHYRYDLTADNSVLIFNNFLHMPTEPFILSYIRRLYEVERTIDVNVKAQKTPVAILSDESQRLTMKNLYMQYDGNEPFIFGSKDLGEISTIQTNAPYVADKLQMLKHDYINEALTFIGVNNSNINKTERQVAPEVAANFGLIEAQRNVGLDARNMGSDQINDMFGLNIKAEFNTEMPVMVNNFTEGGGVKAANISKGESGSEGKDDE